MGEDLPPLLKNTAIACIGPITAKTAKDHGLRVDIMPGEFTVEALAEAIENHFAEKKRSGI